MFLFIIYYVLFLFYPIILLFILFSQESLCSSQYLCFGLFCKLFGDFKFSRLYLEISSFFFPKGLVQFIKLGNFEDLVLFQN